MRPARLAYRVLLLAFPAAMRRQFGEDMTAMFLERLDEPGRGRARYWMRAIADALRHGAGARTSPRSGAATAARTRKLRVRWWVHAMVKDIRYALRVMRRQPGVTFIAVLTLALGIGANTAIFSAVNAVLLRPLPYDDPDRVVTVWEKRQAEGVLDNVVSPADFLDWAKMNTTFESMAAMTSTSADLTGNGEPERLAVGVVSPPFFDVLRVRPALGRAFTPDESFTGRPRVVLLSHKLWVSRFGSERSIVGRKLTLNGNPIEVVGVLPASFEFADELDMWAPLALEGTSQPLSRVSHQFFVYARMKQGVSLEQARTDMERIGVLLQQQYPEANRNHSAWVIPLEERLKGPMRSSLLLLLGAVAFVLLIACVNVANILLARAAGRRREMAVRSAVGAGRARLAGQMLTESVMLAVLGGTAGLLLAWWATAALRRLVPPGLQVVGLAHLRLEPTVLAFTAALSLGTGLLFGLLPAWHLASQDANAALKDGGRGPAGVRRRLRVALVVSEIALASLLLVAAGLTLRSFLAVLEQPAGFRTSGAVAVTITLPGARYRSDQAYITTFDALRERLAALPGARGAGATSHLPLSGRDGRRGITVEGRQPTPDTPTRAHPRVVTPGYMEAMGITVIAGRAFTAVDREGSPPVAIVNDTMARRYWPGGSPLGKRVRFNGDGTVWMEVVGVIADVKHWGLEAPVNPELYQPLGQPLALSGTMTYVVPAAGDDAALASAVREGVRAIDPNLPVTVRTMEDIAAVSVASRRAGMLLVAAFGVLALVLAAAGIHGVMSHLVALRTSEIGVRMTLGAAPRSVLALFLREGTMQAIAGLAVGLTGGVLLMRTFRSILYGVEPADPLTLIVVGAGLLLTALAACVLPARRAMRVDPVTALRS
jgi:putative ABC transport system permease protein